MSVGPHQQQEPQSHMMETVKMFMMKMTRESLKMERLAVLGRGDGEVEHKD